MPEPKNQVSVIIPVFNEEKTILKVIEAVQKYVNNLLEIVVVDDGSKDSTESIVRKMQAIDDRIVFIRHTNNQGKTAAVHTGIAASHGTVVIVQDADLEYDPAEINEVVTPIFNGLADVVFGSRFLVRKASRVLYYRHYVANKSLTFFSNILTDLNMSDLETGYKAFRGEIIRNMVITSRGFGFEIEVTAKVAKLQCRIYEVPISYYGRTYSEGKKIGLKDGLWALYYLIKYNLLVSRKHSFKSGYRFDPKN
jgi:Glycosyltransferases involved in cell wall biogenesis